MLTRQRIYTHLQPVHLYDIYLSLFHQSLFLPCVSLLRSQGGWGWLVVGAAFLVQVLTTGLQLAFGVMAAQITRHFRKENAAVQMEAGQND